MLANPTIAAASLTRRKARKAGSDGKTLEKLVMASDGRGVFLQKIPNGAKYLPGGKTIPCKSPVDFVGVLPGGRMIAFDCKECGDPVSFDASTSALKQHQVDLLVRLGTGGAVAGLLVMATEFGCLYWLPWGRLADRKPTYRWADLNAVPASPFIAWSFIADLGCLATPRLGATMTLDELKAMTPADINALVSTKVMGWKRSECGNYWIDNRRVARWPSTNIADAWLVVEKVTKWDGGGEWDGTVPAFELISPCHPNDDAWAARFHRGEGPEGSNWGHSPSAPLAICYAALLHVAAETGVTP